MHAWPHVCGDCERVKCRSWPWEKGLGRMVNRRPGGVIVWDANEESRQPVKSSAYQQPALPKCLHNWVTAAVNSGAGRGRGVDKR